MARIAGRSGARPIPPAITSTSAPSASRTGHGRPNGPRTPRISPGPARQIAFVARPTARTVCTRGPSPSGSPPIEIGTSPAPKADSIVNCPWANSRRAPERGLSSSVHVSEVSRRVAVTANGWGTIGPGSADGASACWSMAVDVEELKARRLQALGHRRGEAPHQLVAELVIGLALAAQANAVERHDGRRLGRPAIELPEIGLEQPRPAHDVALME